MSVKISVIMPVYNARQHLAESLDSFLGQSLRDIELICIDDGSTDSSLRILRKYRKKDDRIKILTQSNQGAGPARNKGILSAEGEYIAFLDSDDFYPGTNTLELLYSKAAENHALICGGSYSSLKPDGEIRTSYDRKMYWGYTFWREGWVDYRDYQYDYGYQRFLYSRKMLVDNKLFFPPLRRFQDPPFFVRAMLQAGRFYAVPQATYLYRSARKNSMIKKSREKTRDMLKGFTMDLQLAQENKLWALYDLTVRRCMKSYWDVLSAAAAFHDDEMDEALRELVKASGGQLTAGIQDVDFESLNSENAASPKLTVVMPSLNVRPYIEECIQSVLCQSLKNIEVLCIDAGSTDGTLEMLRAYEQQDARVRVIVSDRKNCGYRINVGLREAKGRYFAIVETDDPIVPNMYLELCGIADRNALDFVKGDFESVHGLEDGTREFRYVNITDQGYYGKIVNPSKSPGLLEYDSVYAWAGVYRTDFLREKKILLNETPDASYQDNGFWFQVASRAERAMFVNRPCYSLRRDTPKLSFYPKQKVCCVCEESDFIRELLRRDPETEAVFASTCALTRMRNYDVALSQISEEYKLDFLKRYAEDFKKLEAAGELKERLYTKEQWDLIHDIMANPEFVFYRDYYDDGRVAKELSMLRCKNKESLQAENDLKQLEKSFSFRAGRAIARLSRKLRDRARRCKQSGLRYTCDRLLVHLHVKKDT